MKLTYLKLKGDNNNTFIAFGEIFEEDYYQVIGVFGLFFPDFHKHWFKINETI